MKSRERVIKALELEEPDTVPTFEMIIDPVDTVRAILGREPIYGNTRHLLEMQRQQSITKEKIEWINRQYIRDQYDLYSKLDLDMIRFWEWGFTPSKSVKKISEEEWLIDGDQFHFKGGTLWRRSPIEGILTKGPKAVVDRIKEDRKRLMEDIANAQYPSLEYIRKLNEEDKFILADVGCIWLAGGIADFDEFPIYLSWFRLHPDVVEEIIRFSTDALIENAKVALDHGADGILSCNDFGYSNSSWISPDNFRQFIYPNMKRAQDAIKAKGSFFIVHSDGNNNPLLQMFAEARIDGYQSIDILGGMNLADVKEKIGDKVCLLGNVDLQALGSGTAGDVEKDVKRCIESAAGGGGYILCSSGSMLESRPENLHTMVAYARKIGKYPIKGQG